MEEHGTELRSEKTQHIIGKMPNIIVRWGITIILLILLMLILITYLIRIPNIISTDIIERTSFGINVISNEEINIGDIRSCIIKKDTKVIFSGPAEIIESLEIIEGKTDQTIYSIKTDIPDTIKDGTRKILIKDFNLLTADLIGQDERLIYKLIPLLKRN